MPAANADIYDPYAGYDNFESNLKSDHSSSDQERENDGEFKEMGGGLGDVFTMKNPENG